MVDSLVRSPKAATKEHALESERSGGKAQAVCGAVVIRGVDDDRTLCPAGDLAPGRIQYAGPLSASRVGGRGGAQPCAASSSQPDGGRDRAADRGVAARAHALGAAKVEGGAGTSAAG